MVFLLSFYQNQLVLLIFFLLHILACSDSIGEIFDGRDPEALFGPDEALVLTGSSELKPGCLVGGV